MTYLDSHCFAFMNLPIATAVGQNAFNVHLPPRAPNEARIVRSELMAQLWNPAITGTNFLAAWVDPGGRYAAMGFPAAQLVGSGGMNSLNILPIVAGRPVDNREHPHPVVYSKSRGDCIGLDLAYAGGGGDFYLVVEWEVNCLPTYPTNAAPNGADDLATRLLLNFDEHPSNYRDFSAWCHLTYLQGGAGLNHSTVKFGKGSLQPYVTGNGCMSIVLTHDLVLGASDWTWETWAYPNNNNATQILINQGNGYSPVEIGQLANGTFYFAASSTGTSWNVAGATSMGPAPLNTWTHLAALRSGNAITLWNNGVQQGPAISVSGALYNPGSDWTIGAAGTPATGLNSPFAGCIGETRLSNVARDPALFPPTVSYGGA